MNKNVEKLIELQKHREKCERAIKTKSNGEGQIPYWEFGARLALSETLKELKEFAESVPKADLNKFLDWMDTRTVAGRARLALLGACDKIIGNNSRE